MSLPGDRTPEFSDVEDVGTQQPTGDLADLSRNVGLQPTGDEGTSNGVSTKPKKNKGVGKGSSGSSGPPQNRKRKNNLVQQPAPEDSSDEEEVEINEGEEPGATQHITVGICRGYSVYPANLFDKPPKRICIDHLRKQFMIHEIARARAERRFYRHGMTFMGYLKEFLRMFAAASNMQFPGGEPSNADHAYAMNQNNSYEASEDEGSDVEIPGKK